MRSILIFILISLSISTMSQINKKWYVTSSGEMIFSQAIVDYYGAEDGSVLRFSPFFNSQNHLNKDLNQHFGLFTGLNVRNVGFIYKYPAQTVKTKFRSYNLGIPIGLKFGNLEKSFLYAGYEIEFPFHYKEKQFDGKHKVGKYSAWFSKKQPASYNSVMFGIQFADGTNLKFKYYLTGFFNKDWETPGVGGPVRPNANFDVNVFYISISVDMLKAAERTRNAVKEHDLFF
ncbi:MAG TPA: hypothetical protein PKE03_04405 [Bacteroidales bacterium]|nr:hypothetical protein [Bacteroidales bacterium]